MQKMFTFYSVDICNLLFFSFNLCGWGPHLLYGVGSYAAAAPPAAPWEYNSETKSCYTTTAAAFLSIFSMFVPVCVCVPEGMGESALISISFCLTDYDTEQ